ncbi:unnamed protein product [Staurois parvus]|uniref:Uncharacterized protein n=1 Tax=Staurois parvus TaxID=386267 RepID=A0ABN9B7M9_9NEOB|nr:unnamed protein product [Staurois parvus]
MTPMQWHSSEVYTVLCHGKQSPQFDFLLLKVTAESLHGDFLQPFSSEVALVEVLTSVDGLDVSVRW